MGAVLESLFGVLYAAYRGAFAAFRSADLLASVVASAITYATGAVCRMIVALAAEACVVLVCRWILFTPEADVGLIRWVQGARLLWAFAVFAAGQLVAVWCVFWMLRTLFTYKFVYVLGSDQVNPKDNAYTPFDDREHEADAPDPLAF